jgi:hypothetical protein
MNIKRLYHDRGERRDREKKCKGVEEKEKQNQR